MDGNLGAITGVMVATLCGGAVGLERQRSGHAVAPDGTDLHFAGLRTFTLLGLLSGVAGWLWRSGYGAPGLVLLGSAGILVSAAYVGASRRDVDGTTEVAALVVLAAGFVSGMGRAAFASALIATTVLLLMEKTRLHDWVSHVDDAEFRSGVRFAVMAAVILPLLPEGPYGPAPGVRPRELWIIVLLITGLEFTGYVARRRVGTQEGYTVAGLLGGLVSSTAVTLSYARLSRVQPASAIALASGAIAANVVLFPRVVLTALVLNAPLGRTMALRLLVPFLVVLLALGATRHRRTGAAVPDEPGRNPMNVMAALRLALVYQVAIYAIAAVTRYLGDAGLLASGFLMGMADVDALTISVARQNGLGAGVAEGLLPDVIVIGVLGTTLFKLGVVAVAGGGAFRRRVSVALIVLALSLGAILLIS